MKAKKIIKNIAFSCIIGILLGVITEYALILNINLLIKITQSLVFWGLIICIAAFIPKDYIFSIIDPVIVMALMSVSYYMVRLAKSGYTDIGGLKLYTFTGIAGAMYIGTFIYIFKRLIIKRKKDVIPEVIYFISMTIIAIVMSTSFGVIKHNLFYNIDIRIIAGFFISTVLVKLISKKPRRN